jgi:hypothetical protein
VAAAGFAAIASAGAAGDPSPGVPAPSIQDVQTQCGQAQSGLNPCDTDYTPVAKSPPAVYGWRQVGGATFQPAGSPTTPARVGGSPTPFTVDFYSVSFRGQNDGLAVGAACADETPFAQLDSCPRHPEIWRYATDATGTGGWSKVADLPGSDRTGFVGAVAWIGPGQALAVGGSGAYVRRELGTGVEDPAYADPAGPARAWLLTDGSWRELTDLPPIKHTDGTVVPMRGLDAVACSPTQAGFCVAGGLGQLWTFRDGHFTTGYDAQSGPEVENASQFRFRVREIVFNTVSAQPESYAVTAGCCSTVEATTSPPSSPTTARSGTRPRRA